MPPVPRVSILVVTFGHAEEIDACLEAALAQDGIDPQVVVVDNASPDATTARVRAHGERVTLVENATNAGFAAGMNAAFAASDAEWVLFLNPDCVLDPGAGAALVEHLDAHPRTALASALLREADGSPQLFARRDLDLGVALWGFTETGRRVDARFRGGRGLDRRRHAELWAGGPPRAPVEVFGTPAACLMAARRDLGPAPFDERFPLLFNDGDLSARLHRQGRVAEIVPAAGAAHGYGTSLRRADAGAMRAETVASLRRYARRYRPRPFRAALWILLAADAVLTAALAALGRADPRIARGTLGGLGLPGGIPPLLTRLDRLGR